MDFLESLFRVSPDGGNGTTEVTILAAFTLTLIAGWCARQKRNWRSETAVLSAAPGNQSGPLVEC
jgi:hypothetical protein